ncbi:hypothetical protein SBY92_004524 [Candida maltosa Xu316]|uniref:Uncharacterized protein n=1 Tax=Candida maltosa (strain Xu316) TaxID=1245528 RepID=M3K4E9_CANMX|nr:hypothetical protein G210_5577 [Candida maltosa Xu316]
MFKSSISSYLFPQWFKKSPSNQQVDPKTIPKNFTITNPETNKLINVSMNTEEDEEFVDIQTKPLSYAEVASLGKNKKQNSVIKVAKPSKRKIESNQFNVLSSEETNKVRDSIDEAYDYDNEPAVAASLVYEPFKSDDEYMRSKNYKMKQSKAVNKKKQFNRELKNKQKS